MTSTNNQCAVCSKPGKLCASCENIHYCSPECQKIDWKVHKLLCRTFKNFRNPPGPMMMRVITFPVTSIKPEFRWMPIKKGSIQRPIVDKYFGHDNPLTSFVSFPLDPITGTQLPLRLTVQSRDEFMTDGSLPNRALYQLTEGVLRQPFAGPVLIYGNTLNNNEGTNIPCVNLNTTHLNIIKSWFIHGSYMCPNHKLYRQNFENDTKWWKFGISREAANAMGKEILAKGGKVPNFRPEEFGTPEFCVWHDRVGRYKQKLMVEKQKEEIDRGGKGVGEVMEEMGEEEEKWRSEMRVSARVVGLDVILP
jgi:hypothetical protein